MSYYNMYHGHQHHQHSPMNGTYQNPVWYTQAAAAAGYLPSAHHVAQNLNVNTNNNPMEWGYLRHDHQNGMWYQQPHQHVTNMQSATSPVAHQTAMPPTPSETSVSNPSPGNQSGNSLSPPATSGSVEPAPYAWLERSNHQTQPPAPGRTRTRDKYRVVYTDYQRVELEKEFSIIGKYLNQKRKCDIAHRLSLSERQIKIWFQNRRAKERKTKKKAEEERRTLMIDTKVKQETASGAPLGSIGPTLMSTESSMQSVPSLPTMPVLANNSTHTGMSHQQIQQYTREGWGHPLF